MYRENREIREIRAFLLFALLDILPDFRQIGADALRVVPADDVEQRGEFVLDALNLFRRARVEEDFRQEVIVFREQAPGDFHVPLEGRPRRVLMLHRGGEDHRRGEGDAEGIGHHLVVFLERVFADVQAQLPVQILEKDFAQVVAFRDDDGVFLVQLAEVGKRRTEHRVRRDVAETAGVVILLQVGLDRGDVGNDASLRQIRDDGVEGVERMAQRYAVDNQFRGKSLDLFHVLHPDGVVDETHPLRILFEHRDLVVETQEVGEKRAHLSGSENQYFHFYSSFSQSFIIIICWRTDSSWISRRMLLTNSGLKSICLPMLERFSRISL